MEGSIEDPSRFEAIFERHYDAVRRYAQVRAGLESGEDIAVEVFDIAYCRRETFDASFRSAKPWLLGIASNLIRHHARDERLRLSVLARVMGPLAEEPIDEHRLDAMLLAPRIYEVLGGLHPDDRDAFLLFALGQLSYAEIALALDIPVGTVRSKIFRVRKILRERIDFEAAITERI